MPAAMVTIAVPAQWKIHRLDLKPRKEQTG
jgi:hypothetical protein